MTHAATLTDDQRTRIAQGLNTLLANTYMLKLKTHHFHWNVTGPHFASLHALFEKHYDEMEVAVDEIAERIRAIGEFAAGSIEQFQALNQVPSEPTVPSSKDMIQQLYDGQMIVVGVCKDMIGDAEAANDVPTVDLLTRRMFEHEKNAWMLKSLLE
jgi:starvation-inducible DNA-binding protein